MLVSFEQGNKKGGGSALGEASKQDLELQLLDAHSPLSSRRRDHLEF